MSEINFQAVEIVFAKCKDIDSAIYRSLSFFNVYDLYGGQLALTSFRKFCVCTAFVKFV